MSRSARSDLPVEKHQPESLTPDRPLLEAQEITVLFSSANAAVVRAVDGVSLRVREGETLGIVGESGCGKSTLARALLQIRKPTAGSIRFNGRELTTMNPAQLRRMRREMQMIFQDPAGSLNPTMTAREIVSEPLEIHKLARGATKIRKVNELLSVVGISPKFGDRYPHEFSGGQQQRLGIARALAVQPRLLVADEPTSSLDVSVQAQILQLLMDIQSEFRLTYILISHNLAVVRRLCDTVSVMYLGRIVESAPADDLFTRPSHPYSRALISAVLVPEPGTTRERIVLAGDPPSPQQVPRGCRFHPRCFLRAELDSPQVCYTESPALIQHSPAHRVACHFAD